MLSNLSEKHLLQWSANEIIFCINNFAASILYAIFVSNKNLK